MRTKLLIICAAILCVARSSDVTKPVEIQRMAQTNFSLTCVNEDLTRLEPPPECIVNKLMCQRYKTPLKYLTRSKKYIIKTSRDFESSGRYSISYTTNATGGVLSASFVELSVTDSGLYRCGVITPAGRDVYKEFMLNVNYGRLKPLPYDITTPSLTTPSFREIPSDRTTMDVKKAVGVVGENITVECRVKPLLIQKLPLDCMRGTGKCQSFFQPLLYLQREEDPRHILETYQDYAENGKYSLNYGRRGLQVSFSALTQADTGRYVCGVQAPSGDTTTANFEIIVMDVVSDANGSWLLLLLLLIPVLLLMAGGLWLLIFCKKRKSNRDSQMADGSGENNTGVVLYENIPAPASKPADSTYQTLSADTRDPNHIYCSLNTQRLSH